MRFTPLLLLALFLYAATSAYAATPSVGLLAEREMGLLAERQQLAAAAAAAAAASVDTPAVVESSPSSKGLLAERQELEQAQAQAQAQAAASSTPGLLAERAELEKVSDKGLLAERAELAAKASQALVETETEAEAETEAEKTQPAAPSLGLLAEKAQLDAKKDMGLLAERSLVENLAKAEAQLDTEQSTSSSSSSSSSSSTTSSSSSTDNNNVEELAQELDADLASSILAEADSEVQAKTEAKAEAEAEAETETDAEAEADAEADTEAENKAKAGSSTAAASSSTTSTSSSTAAASADDDVKLPPLDDDEKARTYVVPPADVEKMSWNSAGEFGCRAPGYVPTQSPIFSSANLPVKLYSCNVSPFISMKTWASCQQAHQNCYMTCLNNQHRCDEALQHCMISGCGDAKSYESANCVLPKNLDPKNYDQCATAVIAEIKSLYDQSSYRNYQNHACLCVPSPNSTFIRLMQQQPYVMAPSALESWPFYTINSYEPVTEKNLYEQVDVHDFIPPASRLGRNFVSTVGPRNDVLSMSSASQVIGVDYTTENTHGGYAAPNIHFTPDHSSTPIEGKGVKAGIVIAKGRKILEHYIPTCARLAGGKLLGVFVSHVGGDRSVPTDSIHSAPHKLYVGITEQGQGRGTIMTTSLIIQIFKDKLEVSNVWAPSLASTDPNALGVITLQIWSSVWERDLFFSLIQAELDHLAAALIPVTYHTLAKSASAYPPVSADATGYEIAAAVLGHEHATKSAGAWIESLSFVFPSSVRLLIRSSSPKTQNLQLEVKCWNEANSAKNTTFKLSVHKHGFVPAPADKFLGAHLYTQVMTIALPNTLDSVFILRDLNNKKSHHVSDEQIEYADQAFTNLGYFFFFSAGLTPAATPKWVSGHSDEQGHLPVMVPTTTNPTTVVDSSAHSDLVLPGSGVLSVRRELRGSGALFTPEALAGVSRSLTPLSTAVNIADYWGMSVLVRILPPGADAKKTTGTGVAGNKLSSPIHFQLQVESTTVTDYAYHRSPVMTLDKMECWSHVQIPFTAFTSASGRPLDLYHASKLTFLLHATAEAGANSLEAEQEISVEIGAFSLHTAPLSKAVRLLHAPCSTPLETEQLAEVGVSTRFAVERDQSTRAQRDRETIARRVWDDFLDRGAATTSGAHSWTNTVNMVVCIMATLLPLLFL